MKFFTAIWNKRVRLGTHWEMLAVTVGVLDVCYIPILHRRLRRLRATEPAAEALEEAEPVGAAAG